MNAERQQTTITQLHAIRCYLDHIHHHPHLLIPHHQHTRTRVRFGHPAPADLELLTLTDTRVGVPATLRHWATTVRELRNLTSRSTHYRATTHLLAEHTPWLYANHPHHDKYDHDIRHAHTALANRIPHVQSHQSGTAVPGNGAPA